MPLFERNGVFIKNPGGDGDYYGRWWGGEGRFFDFTNPAARATWKQLLEDNLLKLGAKDGLERQLRDGRRRGPRGPVRL